MVSNAEIIDYVSARIINDLDFLATHGFITREDQSLIRSRLPMAQNTPQAQQRAAPPPVSMPNPMVPSYQTPGPGIPSAPPVMNTANHQPSTSFPLKQIPSGNNGSPTNSKRAVPPPPSPNRTTPEFCRASWDYNADMSEPNDLMFRKGDVIELQEETNADWWTGICRGRSGLFPSNHVQRIPYDPHLFPTAPDGGTPPPASQQSSATLYEKPRFPNQMNNQGSMPPQMNQQQQQQPQGMPQYAASAPPPQEPQKKGKFGKVGGQLGNAMVTGVGFGAGAAIGGGIIDAIF